MLSTIWSRVSSQSSSSSSSSSNGFYEEGFLPAIFYLNQKTASSHHHHHRQESQYFLQSCHLCCKPLALDKEVYMYRGDLGFCSVECRKRQIYLDEMKKIEIATKRILASFHQRRREGGGRCQAAKVPAEECFRQRRHPFLSDANRVIFS